MYEVPESKRSIGQDEFEFAIKGEKFTITKAKFLSGGEIEDLTSGNLSRIFDAFGPRGSGIGDTVRSLDTEQIQALISAWLEDSELSTGESAASSS